MIWSMKTLRIAIVDYEKKMLKYKTNCIIIL